MATWDNRGPGIGLVALLCVGLLVGFGTTTAQAQQGQALTQMRDAFAGGDAEALLGGAADRVEIALLGQSKLYSRAQAIYVMEDFFRRYPPESFTLQNDAQDEGNWFATGRYQYVHADQPLHVYLRMRLKGQQWELREVRIEDAYEVTVREINRP